MDDDYKEKEEFFSDKWCRRIIDYYILAIFVAVVFCVLTFGPVADWFNSMIKDPLKNTIAKACLLFLTTYIVDRILSLNYCNSSDKRRKMQKINIENLRSQYL